MHVVFDMHLQHRRMIGGGQGGDVFQACGLAKRRRGRRGGVGLGGTGRVEAAPSPPLARDGARAPPRGGRRDEEIERRACAPGRPSLQHIAGTGLVRWAGRSPGIAQRGSAPFRQARDRPGRIAHFQQALEQTSTRRGSGDATDKVDASSAARLASPEPPSKKPCAEGETFRRVRKWVVSSRSCITASEIARRNRKEAPFKSAKRLGHLAAHQLFEQVPAPGRDRPDPGMSRTICGAPASPWCAQLLHWPTAKSLWSSSDRASRAEPSAARAIRARAPCSICTFSFSAMVPR